MYFFVSVKENAFYDYIVIGSGPGGSTIAGRLALNNFKVLLIESGPDYADGQTTIPSFWPLNYLNPLITAKFQMYLYRKEDNLTIEYPRGLTLGGSSQVNALIGIKANPSEWDDISEITDDSNWNYDSIKNKYEKLVENCEYCVDNNNKNGWLNISLAPHLSPSPLLNQINPVLNSLLEAVNSKVPFNDNVNQNISYDSWFFNPNTVSQQLGQRSNSYVYIKNIQKLKPSNLHIWTNSFVTKLIIDSKTKNALGVEYVKGSNLYKVIPLSSQTLNSNDLEKFRIYAKREVIVSGGQWMSPQLLQLSGIGDKNILNKYNIDVIEDLPGVGQNQQDRYELPYVIKFKSNASLLGLNNPSCTFNLTSDDPCLIDYNNHPNASTYTSNLILLNLLYSTQPKVDNFPDTSMVFVPLRVDGIRQDWVQRALQYTPGEYLTVNINVARNLTRTGQVNIQSTNAFDQPLIEMKYFNDQHKQLYINRIIENIRFIRNTLFNNTLFSQYIDYEDLPGTNITTDQQLTEYIEKYIFGHHACCTNKMGNLKTDPSAVVNSKGQVKNIKNLRICDISIFPIEPGYYPIVSILTACEKIADDIIKQAQN